MLTLAGVALLAGLALAHPCRGGLASERKPTARAPAYSAESALLLAARAVPSAPPLSTTAVAAVLKKRSHASILSFCTSFSQLSRYGLATPSSHDGCCAGAPICMQPVLRTLCFTNKINFSHQSCAGSAPRRSALTVVLSTRSAGFGGPRGRTRRVCEEGGRLRVEAQLSSFSLVRWRPSHGGRGNRRRRQAPNSRLRLSSLKFPSLQKALKCSRSQMAMNLLVQNNRTLV